MGSKIDKKFEARLSKYLVSNDHLTDVNNTIEQVRKSMQRKSCMIQEPIWNESQQDLYMEKKQEAVEKFDALKIVECPQKHEIFPYLYMQKEQLENLINITNSKELRKLLDKRVASEYPKGISRLLITELMYTVLKHYKRNGFQVEKIGVVLSVYYLTHKYFLSSLNIGADQVYTFFKEHVLLHGINCLPEKRKILSEDECSEIILCFCKLYLQNLPLIRMQALPNYAFKLNYILEAR